MILCSTSVKKLKSIYSNFLCLIEALLFNNTLAIEITSYLQDGRLSKHKSDLIFLYASVFHNMCAFIVDFIRPFV